jgi:ParB family chromosome partitioning protein
VKASRQSHESLVALIRSYGLLQPLVVRPLEGKAKQYEVVAGDRRLKALKEIHKGDGDPNIPCVLRDVDAATADALSLGENFGREAMHPLDEAEAFAKLASGEGKDANAIASEFGVTERYVRQRMKLAALADIVKVAYRNGELNTGTAEAFAAVPDEKQLEVWKELNGRAQDAEQVRDVIAHGWIEASHALFDVAALPPSAVSRDLFSERVLIERQAFMEAQAQTVTTARQSLTEDGWAEVVMGRREDVQDRLYSMDTPEREFDKETSQALAKIVTRREKLGETAKKIGDGDESRLSRLQDRYEELQAKEQEIIENAPVHFSEETKAVATAFLILDPDGRVHREYRVTRHRNHPSAHGGHSDGTENEKPPTSDDLSDKQLAATFTHQALAVREAVLKNTPARKRILALILHDKVRCEALSVRLEANDTTLHATQTEGFTSQALDRLREKRKKLDPFADKPFVEDGDGYKRLIGLTDAKVDALNDILIVECITAHLLHRTELVHHLAGELKVNIREHWRPDAIWLSSYQKIQLSHLMAELRGQVYNPALETRKKSELVELLDKLFTDATDGKLEDKQLADRINRWLPSNLKEEKAEAAE